MRTLRQIAAEGRTVILISHKLEEVRSVADRVTVLRGRRGRRRRTWPVGSLSTRDLARLMVGADLPPSASAGASPIADPTSRASQLDGRIGARTTAACQRCKRVALTVGSGEISGHRRRRRQRPARAGPGGRRPAPADRRSASVLDGADVTRAGARALTGCGVAHIPEDRLGEGLVGNLPLTDNAILKSYDRPPLAVGPFLRSAARAALHPVAARTLQHPRRAARLAHPTAERRPAAALSAGARDGARTRA